jgi:hypothetical protein
MNQEFTERLQKWFDTPKADRDYDEGALMLLQLSNNKIMYANISVNPRGKAEFIEGKLQTYLKFRLAELTHQEVKEMQSKVDEIIKEHTEFKENNPAEEFKAGKRADHDSLPEDIQSLYKENLDMTHRMRDLHVKLRMLSVENSTCPDSERYPFLKELISLDKKLHENWDKYDHFVIEPTPKTSTATTADSKHEGSEKAEEDPAESDPTEDKEDNPKKRSTRKSSASK